VGFGGKMKTAFRFGFLSLAMMATAFAGTISLGSFGVSAGGTFLQQGTNDTCGYLGTTSAQCTSSAFFNPTILNLSTLSTAVVPGEILYLQSFGSIAYNGMTPGTYLPANVIALFSTSNTAAGAIQTGLSSPVTSVYNYPGPTTSSNDIPQDFSVPNTVISVVVPTGAQYLLLGIADSYYADNYGNASVSLSVDPTPEPGTYGLMLAGLGAIVTLNRKRFTRS
jgi:hypothetical protein